MDLKSISASFTRPNNTTTYGANDAVSNNATTGTAMTFSDVAFREGRGGYIQGLRVVDSAYTAAGDPGGLSGELWLFTEAPAGAGFDDNAATALTDAELANAVGYIAFDMDNGVPGTPTTGSDGNTFLFIDDINMPYVCAAGSRDLYGVVIARNAYVPIAVEVFTFTLIVDRENN